MAAQRVLIADDDKDLVDALAQRCRQIDLEVATAFDAMTALAMIDDSPPDLVCLDVDMPAGNGLCVCEMMATDDRLGSIPVIILTGNNDEETVRRCHNLCAYYVPKCPQIWDRLEPLIRDLLDVDLAEEEPGAKCSGEPSQENLAAPADTAAEQLVDSVFALLGCDPDFLSDSEGAAEKPPADEPVHEDSTPWVLCIDDDPDFTWALKLRLEAHGVAVCRAFDGTEGYRKAFSRPADAIILDFEMPNGQGDYVLGRLKDNPATKDIPVIVLTGRKDRALERKMLNLGAAKFLNKPYEFSELREELSRHLDMLPQETQVSNLGTT